MAHANKSSGLRVAIVHDWLYGGGAELVVEALHKMYPQAPIYTSYCSPEWQERLDNKVVTGYLQHWPFPYLRKFLPVLRQRWFSRLDLSSYDLVISSSGNGEAKFVGLAKSRWQKAGSDVGSENHRATNSQPPTAGAKRPLHICYCHTPTHFYWRKYEEYLKNPSFRPKWLARLGLRLLVKPLRKRDYQAAQNVDYFIANSSHIQKDIKTYYGRDSVVIHPPVDVEKFRNGQKAGGKKQVAKSTVSPTSFIMWGRHVPYKRFDLAIEACNQLKLPLTIVGIGPETENLKKIAGPTVTFAGFATHENLLRLTHSATAFLFPGEEDFGIAPVEAMAAGLPVIAYRSGGALDYVVENKTGIFFDNQTAESLISVLKKFVNTDYDTRVVAASANRFSEQNFANSFEQFVNNNQ